MKKDKFYIQPDNKNLYEIFNHNTTIDWKNSKILDFGCNTGNFLISAQDYIKLENYTGIDLNLNSIKMAKKKFPEANFIFYDKWHMSYNHTGTKDLKASDILEEKYDVILAYSVFTHCTVSETQDIFNDLLGLLNSNGQILFTIWSDKDFHGFYNWIYTNNNIPKLNVDDIEYENVVYWVDYDNIIIDKDDVDINECSGFCVFYKLQNFNKVIPNAKFLGAPSRAHGPSFQTLYSLNKRPILSKIKLYELLKLHDIDIEVLKENNVYLMGGSILRLFMNLPLDTDLDFYFVDDKSFKNVDDYFRKNFKFLHKTPLFINYEVNNLIVSLIYDKKLLGTYENLNNSYSDFTISAGCFDFKTETFKYPETYFEDIENKRLTPNSDLNNQFPANLLKRIKKFKEMGFTINDELVDEVKDRPIVNDEFNQRVVKKSWLRNEDVYPIVPNIDVFVNWLMDIKDHPNLEKINAYLWGGLISRPHETKDIDVLMTKRDGQYATLKELEELMVDMFNLGYDIHGFYLDTQYMRIPQWIGDYPRNKEFLKSVERKQLWINYPTKYEDTGIVCKYRRYGLLNCCYMSSWGPLPGWKKPDSSLVHRWVDLNANYARMVDLRKIIKYYDNNKERNMKDFLNKFQEYSGY